MKHRTTITLLFAGLFLVSCSPMQAALTPNPDLTAPASTTSTPTFSPTPAMETLQFYEIGVEYACTSNFCSVEFLNPQVIAAVTGLQYAPDVNVSFDYPFINIDRHGEPDLISRPEMLHLNILVDSAETDQSLQVQSRHGFNGGSTVKFSLVGGETALLVGEIDHTFRDPSNPDENTETFTIPLTALQGIPPQSKPVLTSPTDRMAWAIYYPWIGWRQDLECTDHPLISYQFNEDGSRTEETYRQEILLAKSAGIDGFLVSWFNDPVSNHDLQSLLDAADALDFKIAAYMESLVDGAVNPAIGEWIRHLMLTFGDQPAYMRLDGKPVIMVYGYLQAPRTYWGPLFGDLQAEGYDAAYFPSSYNPVDLDLATGLHQYINLEQPDLASLYASLSRSIHLISTDTERKYFAATVTPGFNNCPYGIDDPPYVIDREGGSFYENQFNAAIASNPDWILITSWNEFGESTNIQPSERYGEYYLDLTRSFIEKWKNP